MKNGLFPLALGFFILFLCGCGAPKPISPQVVMDDRGVVSSSVKLSTDRIGQIRETFIGRSFVFKEDWYEYAIIDSDPLGGFSDPAPLTTFPSWIENRKYRVKAAAVGTLAKIVGIRMYRDGFTFICETEQGRNAYITIINHRPGTVFFGSRNSDKLVQRNALDDDLNTVAWLERNLTTHTVEFVGNLPEIPTDDMLLPSPIQEPTLTAAPTEGAAATALRTKVLQLEIQADPPLVHNNEVLKLVLDYQMEVAGQTMVQVEETRTLMLEGKILPGYPKTSLESRRGGRHTSRVEQVIPARAKAAIYTYEGKVCVGRDCISRSREFEVAP